MEPILMIEPIFKETIWGGTRLRSHYHYEIPSDHTGECWGISAHPSGDCRVLNMPGYTLRKLWMQKRDEFCDNPTRDFPLLIKFIDATDDLSIQVHPDERYANIIELSHGKNECWYVLDCNEDTKMILGHNAKTKEELVQAVKDKDYDHLLSPITIKPNDFYYIPAGTLHAICAGSLIYEAQESSDITYRFYDYDRRDKNGQLRPLHVSKALDVTTVPQSINKVVPEKTSAGLHFLSAPGFEVDKWEVQDILSIDNDTMILCSVIDGNGSINNMPIRLGDHFIITKQAHHIELTGPCTIMAASLKK